MKNVGLPGLGLGSDGNMPKKKNHIFFRFSRPDVFFSYDPFSVFRGFVFRPYGLKKGFWGMTHADVNKSGHTNDFKVVRMESVKEEEIGMPVFAGHYQGYFKLTSGFQTET